MRQVRTIIIAAALLLAIAFLVKRWDAASPRELSVSGNLVRFERATHTLVLATDDGQRRFVLPPNVPLHEGARRITLSDLRATDGCRVKVRYGPGSRQARVHDVRLSCENSPDSGAAEPRGGAGPLQRIRDGQ